MYLFDWQTYQLENDMHPQVTVPPPPSPQCLDLAVAMDHIKLSKAEAPAKWRCAVVSP